MTIKPIIFSGPMVRAILDGRKTMTRRVITNEHIINNWDCAEDGTPIAYVDRHTGDIYPPTFPARYQPGDILWVRETWQQLAPWTDNGWELDWDKRQYYYAADGNPGIEMTDDNGFQLECFRWRPSIYMPKDAARIFLRVTDVRAERVQEITHADALREGVNECPGYDSMNEECDCILIKFAELWESLNAKRGYGWKMNPWVWVYTFERCEKPEGWPL